jgi:hypothetical protein
MAGAGACAGHVPCPAGVAGVRDRRVPGARAGWCRRRAHGAWLRAPAGIGLTVRRPAASARVATRAWEFARTVGSPGRSAARSGSAGPDIPRSSAPVGTRRRGSPAARQRGFASEAARENRTLRHSIPAWSPCQAALGSLAGIWRGRPFHRRRPEKRDPLARHRTGAYGRHPRHASPPAIARHAARRAWHAQIGWQGRRRLVPARDGTGGTSTTGLHCWGSAAQAGQAA